jgi:class 3 adenylate cyclase
LVFADVRGSTALSEELALEEYVRRINAFHRRTTSVFVQTDGFMMDVIGDEVFALYPPGGPCGGTRLSGEV